MNSLDNSRQCYNNQLAGRGIYGEKLLTKRVWVGSKITQLKEEAAIFPIVKTLFTTIYSEAHTFRKVDFAEDTNIFASSHGAKGLETSFNAKLIIQHSILVHFKSIQHQVYLILK